MKRSFLNSCRVIFCLMAIFLFVYSPGAYAQEKKRICATMEVHERLMRTVPTYRENQTTIENLTRAFLASRAVLRTEVVKIPVVVHVVYNTPQQEISDEQIKSQIRILNEDFRKLNTDVASVPSAFQPLAADARIEFALACRGPDGKPTTGITRTQTSVTSFSDDDAVKFTAQGGHDAWPRDKYLNIWVCNLQPYLGYAQFPGGPADTDGVVITYTAFGDTGTAAAPFNKGRTATHEIGHWLNLRHIWGDDCPTANQCGGSDLVNDTPNQECMNYGCPTFPKVSCNNGPNGDLFMDYMDYTDDACMVMFTKGQSARMDAALDGPRAIILRSDGLNCPEGEKKGFLYKVKFVCGKSEGNVVAPGRYWTAINVGNPTDKDVVVKKRFSVALPEEKPGPVTESFKAKLGPYQAFEIDNKDIFKHTESGVGFIKGFAAIESEVELDVVAVYTAAGAKGQVSTLHIEHVSPRCLVTTGCPDLIVEAIERPEWDSQNNRSVIRATIRNIGGVPAGPTVAQVVDLSPHAGALATKADAPTSALAPGDTATVTFFLPYWVYDPNADLKVTADYKNEISECNEDNNVKELHDLG